MNSLFTSVRDITKTVGTPKGKVKFEESSRENSPEQIREAKEADIISDSDS